MHPVWLIWWYSDRILTGGLKQGETNSFHRYTKTSRPLEVPPPCEQGSKSTCHTHEAPSTSQDGSKELDLEWIGPVVVEYQCQQPSRSPYDAQWACPLCPHGQMTMTLRMYKPRRFEITWFGVNRLCDCQVSVFVRFQEPFSRPWAHPLCYHGQMTKKLHIYRPRWFQWTRFGVNRPGGCGVPVSASMQKPLLRPWACPLYPHKQTLHIYRPRRLKKTWYGVNRPGCSIRKIPKSLITNSRSPCYAHGHAHVTSMA